MRQKLIFYDRWPNEICERYERVRLMGSGHYGRVWMARNKCAKECPSDDDDDDDDDSLVAIKKINIRQERVGAYAQREIDILSQVDHPNLIRLIHCFKPTNFGFQFIVMSLANGPNLCELIDKRGALGIHLSRLIFRHLIAAISYLHVRAVAHRDIKPGNCVLVGADVNDELIWSDDVHASEMVNQEKWKAVLVDFGFARALSYDNIVHSKMNSRRKLKFKSKGNSSSDVNGERKLRNVKVAVRQFSQSFRFSTVSRDSLRMSAIGTPMYIAPEILDTCHTKEDETEAIAPNVSTYGMSADSYALGLTMMEVMTGVPPDKDIDLYIASKSKVPAKFMKKILHLKPNKKKHYRKFRTSQEFPRDAVRLLLALLEENPQQRTTVREAQASPWIAGGQHETKYEMPQGDVASKIGDKVVFLEQKKINPNLSGF